VFPALIHHPAWKRVCVKNVFFCVSSRLKSVVVFLAKLTRTAVFARNSSHFEIESQRNDMQREKPNFPKSHHNRQKKKLQFLSPRKIQKIELNLQNL
jgi:hypothetical protein